MRGIPTKPKVLLMSFALLLAATGSVLVYLGYIHSLQLQSTVNYYTTASQELRTSIKSNVVTITTNNIVLDERAETPPNSQNWQTGNCPIVIKYDRTLQEGKVHITYTSRRITYPPGFSPKVSTDFWLQFPTPGPLTPMNLATVCASGLGYGYTVVFSKMSVSDFDGIVDVPKAGEYQFAFVLHDRENPLSFSIKAEQVATTVATASQTLISMRNVTYVTSTISFHPVGLGPQFYAGISYIFASAVVAISLRRRFLVRGRK